MLPTAAALPPVSAVFTLPAWVAILVCALQPSQDVGTERANTGKARAWLHVHNIKTVSIHRMGIPQCLSQRKLFAFPYTSDYVTSA